MDDFRELYTDTYRMLLRYVLLRISDSSLAEDLVAETFTCAFEKYRNGATITSGWLIQTARNLIGNEYQRRVWERGRLQRIVNEEIARVQSQSESLDHDVLAAMERLSPRDALVLQLTYWDGLSAVEVGKFLGCSTGAVWVRLSRARAAIKRQLIENKQAAVMSQVVEGE